MTDFRALIHRMADELDHYRQLLTDNRAKLHPLATEARAALTQPEPEGPTDEELRELWQDSWDTSEEQGAFQFARAVLARWGDGPAVPDSREPASVTARPSDHLYVQFASLEWKLGCHMSEWKAARELACRLGYSVDELNQAHCDDVVRLLCEHLEAQP